MNDMIYTTNKATHYPLTLNATYTCCIGTHSFWYDDLTGERRVDYSKQMSIEEALAEFCHRLGIGGKLMLGTDPITARKIREAFNGKISKERKISLAQRVIELEPLQVVNEVAA
jgi:hypothetical protein